MNNAKPNTIMKRLILFLIFVLFCSSTSTSDELATAFNGRVSKAFEAVKAYNHKEKIKLSGLKEYTVNDNAVIFTSQTPLVTPIDSARDPDRKEQFFSLSTIFLRKSPTIEKRMHLQLGPEEIARMRFVLKQPGQTWLTQSMYQEDNQGWQVYESPTDIYFYAQTQSAPEQIEVKEWIYAEKPNAPGGSEYSWKFFSEEFDRFLEFESQPDGSVALQRYPMVKYVKADDYKEHKRLIGVVREAMKEAHPYIHGLDRVGTVLPVVYETREGIAKKGAIKVDDQKNLTVMVREPESSYPLLIDPTINYGSWVGSSEGDTVSVLAMAAEPATDEIYAGGYANGVFSAGSTTVGTYSGQEEGFVVEIADAATPTVNWLQFLGGTTDDRVQALAVNGDEVYAGGSAGDSVSFDTAGTRAGTFESGQPESFVVEIADAATPTVAWLQWFGVDAEDVVFALAVNGDEVYAGGYADNSNAPETAGTIAGTNSNSNEGFVIEIADAATPTISWLQWLGAAAVDRVLGLAVNGDEVYAGGYTQLSAGWETVGTIAGTYVPGVEEGFVVEIADAATPTAAWRQWMGGNSSSQVLAVAVNGDEVYAGGWSDSFTASWDTVATTAGTFSGSSTEGFVVEIADAATPTIAWRQWLGAGGDDQVQSLAVNGDEIYAGGFSNSSTASWETVGTAAGTYNGPAEGFVVEIADAASPTVAWMQWLGAAGNEQAVALAVNGNEVYAGGLAAGSSASVDTVNTIFGTNEEATAGFVVEIADAGTPTLAWLGWFSAGNGGNVDITAMAVNLNEVYAGGYGMGLSWGVTAPVGGTYSGNSEGFVVEIADAVPPSLAWQQWLGAGGNDQVLALAVNGDEIYAGGYSDSSTDSWDTVATLAGTYTQREEGWVVEIADATTPTLAWQQWLGGTRDDRLLALAVTGDEVYAGGYSGTSNVSWETVATLAGTYAASQEGYVIEIADAATPTLAWHQWLGAGGEDRVLALAVTGDEVYAGGYSNSSTASWDTVANLVGTYTGAEEGFVVEIADSASPTLPWRQWLGGGDDDTVSAVAVTGDEVYAGGYSDSSTASWETVAVAVGTYSQRDEGWVVEIADATTPTVAWRQWLGAGGEDRVFGVAVTGDEVYAGGYSESSTASWDTVGTNYGTYGGVSEGWVVEIADATTPTMPWHQWLGGSGTESFTALALNGDEIYVGGTLEDASGWEATMPDNLMQQVGFYIEAADDGAAAEAGASDVLFFDMAF